MGDKSVNYVDGYDVYDILNKNQDMLDSTKGLYSRNMKGIFSWFVLPFCPLVCAIISFASFEKWYMALLSTIASTVIVTTVATVACAVKTTIGILSIPLALALEGIPCLFSKKFKKELQLSLATKNLREYVLNSNQDNAKYFKTYSPSLKQLIERIETLNTELGRPTHSTTDYHFESFANDKKDDIKTTIVDNTNDYSNTKDNDKDLDL